MASDSLQTRLSGASQMLSRRGLTKAARWTAEASMALSGPDVPIAASPEPQPTALELTAKAYFDNHEYGRCANAIGADKSKLCKQSPAAIFLYVYAQYLYGERRRDRELGAVLDAVAERPPNVFLPNIVMFLEELRASGDADSFLLYWLGVCYGQQKCRAEAIEALTQSVSQFPYNWSAWEELTQLIQQPNEIQEIEDQVRMNSDPQSSDEFMFQMFRLFAYQSLHTAEEVVRADLQALEKRAPGMLFVAAQRALLYYHDSNLEEAARCFETIRQADPFRLEDLDIYSNILYLSGQEVELSILADHVELVDMYRSEACSVVANCYGLLGEHELAVVSWQRALASNPNYSPAWTLLGHEYIELKNPNAAIRSYLIATEINSRDWNAWYGLGQAYEMLQEWTSCLYYYKRALAVRPNDTRFWTALANCFEKLGKLDDAISSFEQAAALSSLESQYAFRIGLLHSRRNQMGLAIKYMKLAQESDDEDDKKWNESACLWLARYYRDQGLYNEAQMLALSLTETPTHDPETEREARAILRQISHPQ